MTVSCTEKVTPDNGGGNQEDTRTEEEKANLKALKYLKNEIMDSYYYWYKDMREVSYSYKTDIFDYFDKILYKKDRWSWMMDGPTYVADESGVMYGTYGVSFGQLRDPANSQTTLDYHVMVRYVYPGSPFEAAGVQRGWILTKLQGKYVVQEDPDNNDYWLSDNANVQRFNEILNYPSTTIPCKFTFTDCDGNTHEVSVTAAESLNTRPCLTKMIFTAADYPGLTEPVGYFHYLGFKADDDINGKSMLNDITEPMAYFKEHNVKTLIVDLRYNGGGDSRASDLLVSYLAPVSARGKVYVTRTHNNKLSSEDKSQKIEEPLKIIEDLESKYNVTFTAKPDSPEFKRLYFITGKGSASASEMSLNGLKPLANVNHVGGVTYGKPNGMYVFMYPYTSKDRVAYERDDYSNLQYVFLPICFFNKNGEGTDIPDDGMVPDNLRADDIYHDFGVNEDNIAACLYHIVHGTYPAAPVYSTKAGRSKVEAKGVELPNKEDYDKNYGRYTVIPDFL